MLSKFRLPDSRDWIGLGTYGLTVFILVLLWQVPELRRNDFFKNLAVLIIGTGWVNGAVAWAYSASKTAGQEGPTINTLNTETANVTKSLESNENQGG